MIWDEKLLQDALLAREKSEGQRKVVVAFWSAAIISGVLPLFPWGRYFLYPFALLSTWAHEMGHGLTAIVMGGDFIKLELFPNLGGQAIHNAIGLFASPLVSIGGLLGPSIAGALIIVLSAKSIKSARRVLVALVIVLSVSVVIWIKGDFGVLGISIAAVVLLGLTLRGSKFMCLVTTQLIGIQFCLGSLADVHYMFTVHFERGGEILYSDTQKIAEYWLLPYWFWGALITGIAFSIFWAAFYQAWIKSSTPAFKA